MSSAPKMKRRRDALWEGQGGRCHWCGEAMAHWANRDSPNDLPRNLATVDHLYHRRHPKRRTTAKGEARYVLACLACNEKRGAEDEKNFGRTAVRTSIGLAPATAKIADVVGNEKVRTLRERFGCGAP